MGPSPIAFLFFLLLGFLGAALGDNNQTHVPPNVPPKAEDKPAEKRVVTPELRFNLEAGLYEHLPPIWGYWKGWASGWIPKPCREAAVQKHLNPWEMEVYSVKYDDCDEPWTICRHFSDTSSIAMMVETLGKIPLGMREYASTIVTVPNLGGAAGLSFSEMDIPVIDVRYDCFREELLAHEISHILDSHALKKYTNGSDFSTSSWWKGNYSLDDAAVSKYALTMWQENFAEAADPALYDMVVPGGLSDITADAKSVSHVISTYKNVLGDIIKPQSKPKCTKRWANHEVVPVDDRKVPPYPAPDVRIKVKGIEQIENLGKKKTKCVRPH
ncbi:hypothetical protein PG993_005417 [Apiospora rasikravindrae]|uniref:Uncharacterized protein n=1 Tax=Apiospora rasikravindrae TaxID=990691 RepID=A0ABR1TI93_9PEZI